MATMTSKLARAAASTARGASRAAALASARAARSAAAARRAAAAVSRAARSSTDAAAADLALESSSEARSFRCETSMNRRLLGGADGAAPSVPLGVQSSHSHIDSCLFPDNKKPRTPKFVADEKDLESDEAIWALYERWCKHFNQERDRDEMARRFNEFKSAVLLVHQVNNSEHPNQLAINKFTDGKLSELRLGGYNAFKQVEFAAKLPKTGVGYVWLNGKYYMELLNGKYYMELPEEFQPE